MTYGFSVFPLTAPADPGEAPGQYANEYYPHNKSGDYCSGAHFSSSLRGLVLIAWSTKLSPSVSASKTHIMEAAQSGYPS